MATWRYIKGSEKDFDNYSEWVTHLFRHVRAGTYHGSHSSSGWSTDPDYTLIAQRERVTSINDDRLAHALRPRSIVKPDGTIEFGCTQTPLVTDNVNHPKHYTQGGIECIDAIKAATVGKSGIEAVCVANVVKYLWRYEEKNGVEDVKKARWYLERLISELSEGESK